MKLPQCFLAAAFSAALSSALVPAWSQTLLVDDFASPVPAVDPSAPSQNFAVSTPGTYLGVSGQVRAAYYWLYLDPLASGATARIGNGAVTVQAGAGAYGELALGYGAYGLDLTQPVPSGTNLNLDLSAFNDLRLTFSAMTQVTNVIVSFYTSNPLAGSGPLYYWDGEININPAADGGPVTADLLYKGANIYDSGGGGPLPSPDLFNFAQIDGMVVIIGRAQSADGDSYTLTNLTLAAVPEPAAPALLLAGLGAMAALRRRAGVRSPQ
jgi:hypothetical protein